MSVSQKIEAAKSAIGSKKEELAKLVDAAASGEDVDAGTIETLTKSIEEDNAKLDSLEKAEAVLAKKAAPAFIKNKAASEFSLEQQAIIAMKAHVDRVNPMQAAAEIYGEDSGAFAVTKAYKEKANINGLNTLVATTGQDGWAAELVRQAYGDFVERLASVSIVPRLAALGTRLDFGGAGYITVPYRGGSAGDLSGEFVGEGVAIPVKKAGFSSKRFDRYKLGVITVFTSEILERSTPAIEGLVRSAILTDTAEMLDSKVLDATAASPGVRPAGLLNGISAVDATGVKTAQDLLAKIRAAITPMVTANAFRKPVIVMNPMDQMSLASQMNATGQFIFANELSQNRFQGMEVIVTTRMTPGKFLIIDAADFVSAFDAPSFMASDTATLQIANAGTNPALHTPNPDLDVTAGPGYSMFQQDMLALRMIMPVAWGLIRGTGTAAAVSNVAL
jgi:HK97 family phage major capsid protein